MNAPILVRQILESVLPFGCADGKLLMLRAYFDDSGTHATTPLVVVGGLIGGPVQWYRFERAWAALLAQPMPGKPPLRAFHLSHCAAREGEFADYNQAERDKITHDFRQIILASGVASVAYTIDRVAWDELVTGRYREFAGPPEANCLVKCVRAAMDFAGKHKHGPEVAIIYDKGRETEKFSTVGDMFVKGSFGNSQVVSFTFASIERFCPLQGADMIATESYWFGLQWLKDGEAAEARPHFRDYLEHMNGGGFILDREKIQTQVIDSIDRAGFLSRPGSFFWEQVS
jgi:hypothetical protein